MLGILNKSYSTTRLVYKLIKDEFLDESGKIKDEFKFKINNWKLKIKDSKIIGNPEDKFQTLLFLPESDGRQGEGGLRTRGFLKFSYRKLVKEGEGFKESKEGEWYSVDWSGNPLFKVEFPDEISEELEREGITYLPLITVITVVLNGENTLEETIRSVLWQTYPNVEYIIIDGGSTDGTLDIIRKYEDAIDYWVSEKDKGIYDAMNKGISIGCGQYVFFMGSNDTLIPQGIHELVVKYIKNFGEYSLLSFPVFIVKDRKIKIGYPNLKGSVPIIHHQGCLFNLHGLRKSGLMYSLYYKIHSDFNLIIRYYKLYGLKYANIPICIFKKGGISNQGKYALRSIYELLKIYFQEGGDFFSTKWLLLAARPFYYFLCNHIFKCSNEN